MKKWLVWIVLALLLIAALAILASNPIVACKTEVSKTDLAAIKAQASGLYSNSLPLVPVYVSVDNVSGDRVYYTIFYFPFGTVGMSYGGDGFNMEKALIKQ